MSAQTKYPCYSMSGRILLKSVFFVFKMLGMAPVSFKNSVYSKSEISNIKQIHPMGYHKLFDSSYILVLTSAATILYYYFFPSLYQFEYVEASRIIRIFNMFVAITQFSALIVIWITFYFKRETIIEMVNLLIRTDLVLLKTYENFRINSKCLIIFFVLLSTIIISTINFITCIDSPGLSIVTLTVCLSMFFTTCFQLEYIFILMILTDRIKSLNKILVDVGGPTLKEVDETVLTSRFPLYTSNVMHLVSLRQAMTQFCRIICTTAKFFSFTILLVLSNSICNFIYNCYHLMLFCLAPLSEEDFAKIAGIIIRIFLYITPIVQLAFKTEDINDEIRTTGDLVHKIISRSILDENANNELEDFSRELLLINVDFSASGLFELNGPLIQSIVGVTCTYLILLFQIHDD